ncbi:hypothetical protein LB572_00670 [Mesorhizobium sp. BH1-1-5]|nr:MULTISPECIES: hypothetical protein [unclassified Mesorhizobium]MBZ9985600.1 hypothetical protein [Mesorhizobium sp. BH1-1-5]
MITLTGELPLQPTAPMREQGFEAPNHFPLLAFDDQFFPTSVKNLEQSN